MTREALTPDPSPFRIYEVGVRHPEIERGEAESFNPFIASKARYNWRKYVET